MNKHSMKKILLIPALSFAMIASTAFAFGGHHGHSMQDKMDYVFTKLGLSDAQQSEVDLLKETYQFPPAKPHQRRRDTIKAIMALDVQSPDYDNNVTAIAESAADEAAQAVKNAILFKGKFLSVLTLEQRETYQEMMNKRAARRHHRD